jgi:hypothetical protein
MYPRGINAYFAIPIRCRFQVSLFKPSVKALNALTRLHAIFAEWYLGSQNPLIYLIVVPFRPDRACLPHGGRVPGQIEYDGI